MELPTYTNIWKIEKRLYKLYDFRLPMPVPVGQIMAFLAIAVPYTVILTVSGLPFSHTWLWLYVLPPGVLAWLVTRPVLEGKRLGELIHSQLRYLGEPGTWCRLAPLAEKEEMFVAARVWRADAVAGARLTLAVAETRAPQTDAPQTHAPETLAPETRPPETPEPAADLVRAVADRAPQTAAHNRAQSQATYSSAVAALAAPAEVEGGPGGLPPGRDRSVWPLSGWSGRAPAQPADAALRAEPDDGAGTPASATPADSGPPVVRVLSQGAPLHLVERALRSAPAGRGAPPVLVVPGGHRPGKPDQVQRDQARTRLALPGPARVVMLGCTAGAGQTIATLLTGQLLASLRGENVAVLDFGDGAGSLAELAKSIPILLPGRPRVGGEPGRKGALHVVTAGPASTVAGDAGQIIDSVVARYPLMLADPDPARVPQILGVADRLVLVTPASSDAAHSLAMTLEWLEAHDHGDLVRDAIIVVNAVSPGTAQHAAKAVMVARGRCRAIVQVPWDERLRSRQPAAAATVQAFTALAGVLVVSLAEVGGSRVSAAEADGF